MAIPFFIGEEIEFINKSPNEEAEWASYGIYFEDKEVFRVVYDKKNPEKNTLTENFKDCLQIPMLLKQVYELGKNNVDIKFGLK